MAKKPARFGNSWWLRRHQLALRNIDKTRRTLTRELARAERAAAAPQVLAVTAACSAAANALEDSYPQLDRWQLLILARFSLRDAIPSVLRGRWTA